MTTFETTITPAEALRELKEQQAVLEYCSGILCECDDIPEVKVVQTMLRNWFQQSDHLLDELSPLLCLSLIDPNTTLQTSPRIPQSGTVEKPKPTDYPLPLPIAS